MVGPASTDRRPAAIGCHRMVGGRRRDQACTTCTTCDARCHPHRAVHTRRVGRRMRPLSASAEAASPSVAFTRTRKKAEAVQLELGSGVSGRFRHGPRMGHGSWAALKRPRMHQRASCTSRNGPASSTSLAHSAFARKLLDVSGGGSSSPSRCGEDTRGAWSARRSIYRDAHARP